MTSTAMLLRQTRYEAALALCMESAPAQDLPVELRHLRALPPVTVAEVRAAQCEIAALLDPFADEPEFTCSMGPAYFICMTPRSGSTFLARGLTDAGVLGHPGEYLHRNEATAMPKVAMQFRTPSVDSYLARIMLHSVTPNGVCGIKTDFGSLLPLLIEGTFDRLCAGARVIYLTREDLAMQAISLARAQITGAWSTSVAAEKEATFHFQRIHTAAIYIGRMMMQWETLFAFRGIRPLRVTYEEIDADVDTVIERIADFVGVNLSAKTSFRTRRDSVQRDALNDAWRTRFLTELGATRQTLHP